MSDILTGKISVVAVTGGIRLEGDSTWFNPPKDKAQNIISSYTKGDLVEIEHEGGKIITISHVVSEEDMDKGLEAPVSEVLGTVSPEGKKMLEQAKEGKLPTVDIKGNPYVMVKDRIKEFRRRFPLGCIRTTIVSHNDGIIVFQASIIVKDVVVAVGHSREKDGDSMINKTSYLENAETSSVGRALGFFSIGVDDSMASADEVATAIKNQGVKK